MRQAEIALRTALGASRGRIVAQLFIEAFVLSAVAALAGVANRRARSPVAGAATLHIASELPFWLSFQLSPGAVLYAGVLSVLAAAIVGIVPALKATRREVQTGLRIIGAGGSGHAARKDLDDPDRRAGRFRRGAVARGGLQRLGNIRGPRLPILDSRQTSFSLRSLGWTGCRARSRPPTPHASSPAGTQAGRSS